MLSWGMITPPHFIFPENFTAFSDAENMWTDPLGIDIYKSLTGT
jgi:hypothetical protein